MTGQQLGACLAALVVSGCGGATPSERGAARDARDSCAGIPPPTSRNGPPAFPRPVSPEGLVTTWSAEYWEADLTGAKGGLCVVSKTRPGTFALTGVVLAEAGPVPSARITLEALNSAPAVRLEAVTDENGAFAFVSVPLEGERSCLRKTITTRGAEPWVDLDWVWPGEFVQTIELDLPRPAASESCIESS
jgi:hypothetical protein